MDLLSFAQPIERQFAHSGRELAIATAVKQVMAMQLGQPLQDLVDYGAPHLGSRTVIERFTKQDGLAVLRRPAMADVLMRIIYANWSSIASERGLAFLEFVLKMLWPNQWQIVRLWHSIPYYEHYPRFLIEQELENYFLTSRIRIKLDNEVNRSELSELSPILRRLVPAHIVPQVVIDVPTEPMVQGCVTLMRRYQVADFSNP